MRALLVLSVAALVCLPLASANPVPTIAITIDQSSLGVNATNASQPVTFTGSVSVNKSALLSATVTLTAAVDSSWEASLSPASMTFTSTTPQSFSCTVVVPAGVPVGNESVLTINGIIVSGFLQNTASASATIQVTGTKPPPANQTGNNTNGTKPSNGGNDTYIPPGISSTSVSAGMLGLSYVQWGVAGAVLAVALVSVAVFVRVRRRRKAALDVDSVEEA